MNQDLSYIADLAIPLPTTRSAGRKSWSVDVETVWVPYFTATNVMGRSRLPSDVLGAPLRLRYDKDGTPRFDKSGKPTYSVAKSLSDQVRIVRENFVAGLKVFTHQTAEAKAVEMKAEIEAAQKAGQAIHDNEQLDLEAYEEKALEEYEKSVAQSQPQEAETPAAA